MKSCCFWSDRIKTFEWQIGRIGGHVCFSWKGRWRWSLKGRIWVFWTDREGEIVWTKRV